MKFIAIISLGTFLSTFGLAQTPSASWSDDHVRSAYPTKSQGKVGHPGLVAGTFSQKANHFGQNPGNFSQRYWVDSQYAGSPETAPVLYHICGEGNAESGYFLNDNAVPWAKILGAHIVYLEHRYYGKSLPYADLSNAHLKYLTLGNILEDLADFQRWISSERHWSGKWIVIGGSYSGTLAALYRQAHSELAAGALASSAPMISGVGSTVNTATDLSDLSSTDPSSDTGARQWAYQACTTFGFWEADGWGISATLMNPGAHLCHYLFGNVGLADVHAYNENYDVPFISNSESAPSNILFTYGSNDVWTKIGLAQQTNENSKIAILMINGAGHHFDLNLPTSSDSASVVNAREEFITEARQWL
jgi:pimeloyl-ACP methyl ester carboxylesterase